MSSLTDDQRRLVAEPAAVCEALCEEWSLDTILLHLTNAVAARGHRIGEVDPKVARSWDRAGDILDVARMQISRLCDLELP